MNKTERRRRMFNGVGAVSGLYLIWVLVVVVWVIFSAIAQAMGPVL